MSEPITEIVCVKIEEDGWVSWEIRDQDGDYLDDISDTTDFGEVFTRAKEYADAQDLDRVIILTEPERR